MQTLIKNNYTIFSIDNVEDRETRASFAAFMFDKNIPSKRLTGSYTTLNGDKIRETSWIVPAKYIKLIRQSGFIDRQESLLHLSDITDRKGRRKANLEYLQTNQHVPAGFFGSTTREDAIQSDGYTYDRQNDTFYTLTK